MAEIKTKEEFYALYNRGLLGNMLRNWTFQEWSAIDALGQGYPVDVVAARCTTQAGALMRYDLKPVDALHWVREVSAQQGITPHSYQFAECAPDHNNTLQGEVMRTERYLYMRYTLHSGQRMRHVIDDPAHVRHAEGLTAHMLLKRYMDATSYDTLTYLWDTYPDAVVEFCCYQQSVGVLKANTLFWEARTGY